MPFVFSNQELYVAYPGNNKTACKQWTATEGVIKGFAVNHATEGGYDFVAVSVDGVQRYNGSNTRTRYVNISDNPGTTIEICITTDVGYKGGFGGEITGLIYN